MKVTTTPLSGEIVARRMFFLAYQACGGEFMYGCFRARENPVEEEVWQNVLTSGDYPGAPKCRPGNLYGDYVFGRMLKLKVQYDRDSVTVRDDTPDRSYQGWSRKSGYPSYAALVEAAIKSLGEENQNI